MLLGTRIPTAAFRRGISSVLPRISPIIAAAVLLLAACSSAGPAISDPREIMTQGLEATADLTSVHVVIGVDGTATLPEMGGGQMNLAGTTLEGDLDIANSEAHLTFAVPSLLGLSGEVIQVGPDTYVKTSMTGTTWSKSTASATDPLAEGMDPTQALAELRSFLDTDGVELDKLDDTDCGDRTCYAVRLTVPASVLADTGTATGVSPGDLVGDALVLDLLFDRQDLWLTQVSTELSAATVGELTLRLTLSAFNEDVSIQAPPPDEVTEGGGPILPF